ncbi:mRNA cap guanine-N7 methyltransferase [Episyrphus balteatus]|uniref:mRNA cap guanine-N7 methyltransferase n=1 Tax=Episyrphus balteatus TaxID=286459 RepID=UPI00248629D0|nr:mRNA cap guanine-N7 methyltransferase [Episyrphus balteatus]
MSDSESEETPPGTINQLESSDTEETTDTLPNVTTKNPLDSSSSKRKRRESTNDHEDDTDISPSKCPKVDNPNATEHSSVVASHYNKLKEAGLGERSRSRILYMRNFNNWTKSMFINEYLNKIKNSRKLGEPIRVMDMCCGKGGDLFKWEKGGITHLICTDIAEVSVEQCKSRYDGMMNRNNKMGSRFSAEFFACDSTLVRLRERYKDRSLKLQLVSCQFAFHYAFESLTQADCMVRNAAECLEPNGYFIATIPNANEIMRRLRQSENRKSFGNDLYRIDFISDADKPTLFGAKYQFHLEGVVDCPEFLVHFPTLVKLCRKHGLQLARKSTFAEYYKEFFDEGRSLLERMQALQSYFVQKTSKDDEEFAHVRKVANATNHNSKPYGTLSKSEWEAATLYMVCAFKKCNYTWDAEGKPVYEFDS